MAFEYLSEKLAQQQSLSRYRQRHCVHPTSGTRIKVSGKEYINFSSNDYLGLSQHPVLLKAMQEGVDKFGASAGASSLVTGYHYAHQALEETICEWLNKPKCLLFSSGFSANQGVLNALGHNDTTYLLDKLSHASLLDGALSSASHTKRFKHNDLNHLTQLLDKAATPNNLIVSEGVFSMDGDQAKVSELAHLAHHNNAWLYLDDAHSVGVVGDKGEGSISYDPSIDIVMATFGKAIATSGAFVACNETLYEYLVNFARHYIYSTAISPAVAWTTKASIEYIKNAHAERDKIKTLSHIFSTTLDSGIKLLPSESSIHGVVLGDEITTLKVSEKLKDKGLWVSAIRPPTVSPNSSRLRVTICSNHNANDIRLLARSINEAVL